MKIYFSHGKESEPWGSKIKRLASIAKEIGCDVDSIDYRDTLDADVRVERLLNILKNEQDEIILVGSSMGGYVSLVVSEQVKAKALFLLAPALFMEGYQKQSYVSDCQNIEIVHGWSDEIIPVAHSIQYAKAADCTLHLISGDHRLMGSLDLVAALFQGFLARIIQK